MQKSVLLQAMTGRKIGLDYTGPAD